MRWEWASQQKAGRGILCTPEMAENRTKWTMSNIITSKYVFFPFSSVSVRNLTHSVERLKTTYTMNDLQWKPRQNGSWNATPFSETRRKPKTFILIMEEVVIQNGLHIPLGRVWPQKASILFSRTETYLVFGHGFVPLKSNPFVKLDFIWCLYGIGKHNRN